MPKIERAGPGVILTVRRRLAVVASSKSPSGSALLLDA